MPDQKAYFHFLLTALTIRITPRERDCRPAFEKRELCTLCQDSTNNTQLLPCPNTDQALAGRCRFSGGYGMLGLDIFNLLGIRYSNRYHRRLAYPSVEKSYSPWIHYALIQSAPQDRCQATIVPKVSQRVMRAFSRRYVQRHPSTRHQARSAIPGNNGFLKMHKVEDHSYCGMDLSDPVWQCSLARLALHGMS